MKHLLKYVAPYVPESVLRAAYRDLDVADNLQHRDPSFPGRCLIYHSGTTLMFRFEEKSDNGVWWFHHRDPQQGPARIFLSKDYISLKYVKEGDYHRPFEEGPALIEMGLPDHVRNVEFYLENTRVPFSRVIDQVDKEKKKEYIQRYL